MSLERRLGVVERTFDHWDGDDMRTWFGPQWYRGLRQHLADLPPLPPMSEADYTRFEEIIGVVWARAHAKYPNFPEEHLMYQFTWHDSLRDLMTPQEIAEAEALLGIVHEEE